MLLDIMQYTHIYNKYMLYMENTADILLKNYILIHIILLLI